MDEHLVNVCEAKDGVEQLLICQLLREAGIRCIGGYNSRSLVSRRRFRSLIQVLPQDALQARVLIADFRAKTDAGALAVEESESSASPEEPPMSTNRGFPVWAILLLLAALTALPLLLYLFSRLFQHG